MRLLASLPFLLVLAVGAAPVPCRNLKSEAQCAADEKARQRERPSVATEQVTEVRMPGVVPIDRILVEANPEDLPVPEKSRWEKFERSLQGTIVTEIVGNDGVRMWCRDPCLRRVNCCVRGPEFNTTGREAGR